MGPKTFEDANKDCKSRGGKLPLPTTDAMNTEIVDIARAGYVLAGSPTLSNLAPAIWIDVILKSKSEPALEYTNWKANTPNNLDQAPVCVRINIIGKHNAYKWDDRDCTTEFSYICEIEGELYTKSRVF